MKGYRAAAVVVDVQGDFTTLKNGALAVEGTGRDYVDQVETALARLRQEGLPIIATQDWHPANHISFFTNTPGKKVFETLDVNGRTQVLWPPHCIQDTENAKILLKKSLVDRVVKKGTRTGYDSYSGFFDDGGLATGLSSILKDLEIKTVLVFGLATDYCVRATALDGMNQGFQMVLVRDLCRAVAEETRRSALEEMKKAGVVLIPRLPEKLSDLKVSWDQRNA